jgi:hypothetical protein
MSGKIHAYAQFIHTNFFWPFTILPLAFLVIQQITHNLEIQ